jgi:hypothetical protein
MLISDVCVGSRCCKLKSNRLESDDLHAYVVGRLFTMREFGSTEGAELCSWVQLSEWNMYVS